MRRMWFPFDYEYKETSGRNKMSKYIIVSNRLPVTVAKAEQEIVYKESNPKKKPKRLGLVFFQRRVLLIIIVYKTLIGNRLGEKVIR